ncbi:MAG: hypothetical protein M3Q60_22055 [Actinomycetota bacterium]|nr:hypothetical protein [Actinomycetota bacterium]
MRLYEDWRLHGGRLPHAGGTMDQPAMWHLLIGLVEGAGRRGEAERED